MRSRGITHRPRTARRSEPGAKTERQRGGEGYEGEDGCGPGNHGGKGSRDKGGNWRMDRVHEAKPAPNEPTGDDETQDAGGKSNKKLQHIEFPKLRWRAVTVRNAGVKDSAVGSLPTWRDVVCESQAIH